MKENKFEEKQLELEIEHNKLIYPIFVKAEKQQIVRRNLEVLNTMKKNKWSEEVTQKIQQKALNFLNQLN